MSIIITNVRPWGGPAQDITIDGDTFTGFADTGPHGTDAGSRTESAAEVIDGRGPVSYTHLTLPTKA